MANQLDLPPHYRQQLELLLQKHLPTVEVWAYGSRVKGQSHDGSDLDLVLRSPELQPIPADSLASFSEALQESPIPFLVAAHDWARLPESCHPEIEREHLVLVAAASRPLDQQNSAMKAEWRETSLGELIELKRGYDLPQRKRSPGPFPLVSSSGVTDYQAAAKVAGPGVVTGRYGTLGKVFFISEDFWPLNTTLYVRDFKGNDPRFISYFLRSIDLSPYSDKAAVPGLNRNHLHQAQVRFPAEVAEQRTIAQILGTLDDKIELNRQLNESLEELVRAIFKDWFVDFGPVRAKLEGRDTGLPEQLAALFPDRLVESELGGIPEGWGMVSLPEMIELNPKRVLAKGEVAPYLDMANMPTKGHTPDQIRERPFGSGMRFTNGDTLVARITPCLENGKTAYVDFLQTGEVGWGSTEYIVMRPRPPLPGEFAYGLARSSGFREFAIRNLTGTSGRQRLPVEVLSQFLLPAPSDRVAKGFERIVRPLLARASQAARESRSLAAVRDALLPKLVLGEVRVDVKGV